VGLTGRKVSIATGLGPPSGHFQAPACADKWLAARVSISTKIRRRAVSITVFDWKGIVLRHLRTVEAELLDRVSQVQKALSVLGESETDAALKRPRRRADLLREYWRDSALPYLCLISSAIVPLHALGCPAGLLPSRKMALNSTQPCCLPSKLKAGDVNNPEIHGISPRPGLSRDFPNIRDFCLTYCLNWQGVEEPISTSNHMQTPQSHPGCCF
jgi:hypothetical protein